MLVNQNSTATVRILHRKGEACGEKYRFSFASFTFFIAYPQVEWQIANFMWQYQPKKEMSTPAATAEPMTPEMLLDMQ